MEDSHIGSDKRKELRVPLLITKVKAEQAGKVFFGYAKSISKTGMFIQSVSPKDVGERFRIEFALPKDIGSISCTVEVVWKRDYRPWDKQEPGMGLNFIDLGVTIANKINNWVLTESEERT